MIDLTERSVTGAEEILRLPAQTGGNGTKRAVNKAAGVIDELLPAADRDAGRRPLGIEPGKRLGPYAWNAPVEFDDRRALLVEIVVARRGVGPTAFVSRLGQSGDIDRLIIAIDAAQRPGCRSRRGSAPWLNRFQVNELSRTDRPGSDLIKVYCAAAFGVVANRPRVGRGHRHP